MSAFEFAAFTDKRDTTAGLGAAEPAHVIEKRQASDAWNKFCTITRFKVGKSVKIGGRAVTIERIEPVSGFRVHIKGHSSHGSVDSTFSADELGTV
jgi:hypothetical protein